MTDGEARLWRYFCSAGYIVPEWLLKQQPILESFPNGDFYFRANEILYEAEQFSFVNVNIRYELISRHSN